MTLHPNRISHSNAPHGLAGGTAHIQHPVHRILVLLIKLNCQWPEVSFRMNNVVVTEFSASGFTAVGRQPLVPG